MIKKILFRVIVAVLVCVILSKLKLLGIMKVNALEVNNQRPTSIAVFSPTIDNFQIVNNLYDYSILAGSYRGASIPITNNLLEGVSFNFATNGNINNRPLTASFSIYVQNVENHFFDGMRVYIKDVNNNISSCFVSSNTEQVSPNIIGQSITKINPVVCPNVVLSGGYNIFVLGKFNQTSGNNQVIFAISNVTFIYNNNESLYLAEIWNTLRNNNNDLSSIKNNTKETNDLIKNEDSVSNDDIQSVLDSQDESNSPITDLITMPLTLLNNLYSGFSSSCQNFNLGNLYGSNLVLPCINLSNRLGALWGIIDILFSIFMAYNIGMMCVRIYNNLTTLKDDSNSVYGGGGS